MDLTRMKKDLVKKWSGLKGPLNVKGIEDVYVRENISLLLDNQATRDITGAYISESDASGASSWSSLDASTNSDWRFRPIALALTRRTFPELFANKVVGVQAMPGPVGLAFALRFTYDKSGQGTEAAWDVLPTHAGYSGNGTSGTDCLTSGSYTYGSGSTSGTTSIELGSAGTGLATSAGEKMKLNDGSMNQIGLRIDRLAIEAITRKLGASYTLEAAQDIKVMHGIDIEREMVQVLQYEITAELDRELIYRMKKTSVDTSTVNGVPNGGLVLPAIDVTSSASFNQGWGGTGERFMNIVAAIVHQGNQLAITTRRGAGNFVVVSPAIATALQGAGHQFVQYTSKVNATTTSAPIGRLNGTMEVYRDQYANTDYALVGYKGTGISDSGIIFSPYMMGLTMRAVDPNDFYPRVGVMSRYAIVDSLLGSGRYYRLLNFTNVGSIIAGAAYGTGTVGGYCVA
jgi:hypothetical protein